MHRQPVKSSNIKTAGYDPIRKKMEVEFHDGAVYEFDGVSRETFRSFENAESKGSFFQSRIRPVFGAKKVK